MPNLLVSYIIRQVRQAPVGQRIWDSGLAENHQSFELALGPDGSLNTVPVTPGWKEIATLNTAQLDAVREAIRAANVAEIPPEISRVVKRRTTISSAEWQVATADGIKVIRVAQWGPLDDAAKPLMDLMIRIGMIANTAAAGLETVPD